MAAVLLFVIGALPSCSAEAEPEPPPFGEARVLTQPPPPRGVPTGEEDGQWMMPAKNFASTRFSGLDEITTENVSQLGVAWTFSTGVLRGHEAAPLVVGSKMYLVTPFPNHLIALDLSQAGAPMLWRYEPPLQRAAQGVACCDVVNRGAVYSDGRVFFNTLDNQTVAVDAATGVEVWRTRLGDIIEARR